MPLPLDMVLFPGRTIPTTTSTGLGSPGEPHPPMASSLTPFLSLLYLVTFGPPFVRSVSLCRSHFRVPTLYHLHYLSFRRPHRPSDVYPPLPLLSSSVTTLHRTPRGSGLPQSRRSPWTDRRRIRIRIIGCIFDRSSRTRLITLVRTDRVVRVSLGSYPPEKEEEGMGLGLGCFRTPNLLCPSMVSSSSGTGHGTLPGREGDVSICRPGWTGPRTPGDLDPSRDRST